MFNIPVPDMLYHNPQHLITRRVLMLEACQKRFWVWRPASFYDAFLSSRLVLLIEHRSLLLVPVSSFDARLPHLVSTPERWGHSCCPRTVWNEWQSPRLLPPTIAPRTIRWTWRPCEGCLLSCPKFLAYGTFVVHFCFDVLLVAKRTPRTNLNHVWPQESCQHWRSLWQKILPNNVISWPSRETVSWESFEAWFSSLSKKMTSRCWTSWFGTFDGANHS